MAFAAGRLRHRVEIQEKLQAQDPNTGAITHTWQTVAGCGSLASEVRFMSAKEFVSAQAQQSEIVGRITIRYRDGLNAAMRILHKGNVYNPAGFLPDDDSGLEYLTIPVSRGVNDG
jgi:SPP1 family predicted phage head-tail adaptor